MYIAQNKRKDNIAEYILYIWQLEDLLRALQFSPEAIYSTLVKPQNRSESESLAILEWYMGIVDLLQKEGKQEHGHLEHTLHLINDLHNLHLQLMQLPVGERYRSLYAHAAVELPKLGQVLDNKDVTDIELCFRALYSVVLYRIKKEESARSNYINDVLDIISPLVAELAKVYGAVERGEVDLYKSV